MSFGKALSRQENQLINYIQKSNGYYYVKLVGTIYGIMSAQKRLLQTYAFITVYRIHWDLKHLAEQQWIDIRAASVLAVFMNYV